MRWTEARIVDPERFYEAFPQARVSDALLERLAPDIAARARALDQDGLEQEEIRAEIRARIVECAASYRRFDDDGLPVFDYLEQHPSYVVQHAAIPAYSRLRRERREGFATIRIDEEREDDEGRARQFELAEQRPIDPLERLVVSELADSIGSRLDGVTYRVFSLLVEGLDRIEIADRLSTDRRRIHEHVAKIRVAATAALLERDAASSAGAFKPAADRLAHLIADRDPRLGGESTHAGVEPLVDDVAPEHQWSPPHSRAKHRRTAQQLLRARRLELVEELGERDPDDPALLRFAA